MANPENPENIEFRRLGLRGFEQFHRMILQGTIICPKPDVWNNFYKQFVRRANPDTDLLPRILGGWSSTSNEEKNAVFIKQIKAAGEFYKALDVKPYTWQKEIFDYFDNLEGRKSELVVIWKKGTVSLVVSNLVQRFRSYNTKTFSWFVAQGALIQFDENSNRLKNPHMRHRMRDELYQSQTATVLINRYENISQPDLVESYCQFGGADEMGGAVRPTADFRLTSNLYDHIERAFLMPCPQIEFKLEFTESIQQDGMSLLFDQSTEPSHSSNHFTLDTNVIAGAGLWYAHCELVEIKNVSRQ
jgi:hypothetical protein